MIEKDEVRIDLLLAESNDIERGDYGMEFPVAAFLKIGPDNIDLFIETLLKFESPNFLEWEKTKKSLEIRKEEIKMFLNKEKWYFSFGELDYSLKNIPLIEPGDSLIPERRLPCIDFLVTDVYETDKAYGQGNAPCNMWNDIISIPLVTENNWPGIAIGTYMPFTIKDNKLYMFNWDGDIIGGPYIYADDILNDYYVVESESGKKHVIDINGKRLIEDIDGYEDIIKYDDNEIISERYCLFFKNEKIGYINPSGEIHPPIYDEISQVSIEEDGKYKAYVRIANQWGYAYEGVDFEPQSANLLTRESNNLNSKEKDENLPL